MRRRRLHVSNSVIGALVLIAVAVVSYLVFRGVPFVHGYRITAIFRDANQLRPGSPVRIAGIQAGQVIGLDAGPGHTTKVTLEINDDSRPIHTDATVLIRPRLFLEGGFYAQLQPGTPRAPELPEGGTIPLPQTADPVQFADVLSTFDTPTRNSLRGMVRETAYSLAGGGADGLRRTFTQLPPLLRDVAIVAEAARGTQPGDLPELVRSAASVTGALASRDTELGQLVENLDRTARALGAHDGALGATVHELDDVLREAPPALTAVDRALPPLRTFSRTVEPGLRIAPPILDRLSGTLGEFAAVLAPGERERVITAVRTALQDLPVALDRLAAVFPATKPVTDCLTSHALPVVKESVPDGDLSSGRPVWQDFAHALVGLSSVSQNFDANGYAIRYLAGGGTASLATSSLPGIGALFGTAPSQDPILGSRPQYLGPGVTPPFRPDADCSRQPLPNLASQTGPAGLQSKGTATPPPHMTLDQIERLLTAADRRRP